MSKPVRLAADCRASAAAEMALITPLLLLLLFGAVETGNYFLSEHVVQKGVRDAARYASRLPISDYPACEETADAETRIRRVARTGEPNGTEVRVGGWTADDMTDVEVDCLPINADRGGIYSVYPFPDGVPVVKVSATVPYQSVFGAIGLGDLSLELNADSQAAVFAQ